MTEKETLEPAGLLRRLGAMFYDTLLLFALLFFATAVGLIFTGGEATASNNPFMATWLFFVSFFFHAWPWTHGGQTLGMKTWRIRVERIDGGPLTLWHALLRFLCAIPALLLFGLGLFWMVIDRNRQTLYDRFSETHVVSLPNQNASPLSKNSSTGM